MVTKPAELANAQAIHAMAETYHALPWPGSLLEQPAIAFLRIQNLIALGGTLADERKAAEAVAPADPFAAIEMVSL